MDALGRRCATTQSVITLLIFCALESLVSVTTVAAVSTERLTGWFIVPMTTTAFRLLLVGVGTYQACLKRFEGNTFEPMIWSLPASSTILCVWYVVSIVLIQEQHGRRMWMAAFGWLVFHNMTVCFISVSILRHFDKRAQDEQLRESRLHDAQISEHMARVAGELSQNPGLPSQGRRAADSQHRLPVLLGRTGAGHPWVGAARGTLIVDKRLKFNKPVVRTFRFDSQQMPSAGQPEGLELPASELAPEADLAPEPPPIMKQTASTCAICLCEYQHMDLLAELSCGHCFHDACIQPWLWQVQSSQDVCPMRCYGSHLLALPQLEALSVLAAVECSNTSRSRELRVEAWPTRPVPTSARSSPGTI